VLCGPGLAPRPAQAETAPVQLDARNVMTLAVMFLDQGRPAEALAFAEALLQRNPQDPAALALKSRAERDLQQFDAAVASGRAAWRAAESAGARFDAAMAVAQGLASGGQKFRAQFWLRRAMEAAPDEGARREAERDFAYVRNRSRLWLRFDASLRPSSNVNNGSSNGVLWFYGLPFALSGDAMALSGTEAQAALTLKYRVQEDERSKTDLRFGLMQKSVRLSTEAKAQAPRAKNSDYALTGVELAAEHVRRLDPRTEALAFVTLGKSWYGGQEMSEYLRLDLGMSRKLGKRLVLKAQVSAEAQERQDNALRSADIGSLSFGGALALGQAGDRAELMVTLRDTRSGSAEIDHDLARLRLDWDRGRPVLGAALSLGVWAETRDYARSRYSVEGREDMAWGGELSVGFEKIDYMGFVPVMTIEAQKTDSTIGLFDSETLGLRLSIRSKF
jgi:tetratricopeptide (TPR) repeat protein